MHSWIQPLFSRCLSPLNWHSFVAKCLTGLIRQLTSLKKRSKWWLTAERFNDVVCFRNNATVLLQFYFSNLLNLSLLAVNNALNARVIRRQMLYARRSKKACYFIIVNLYQIYMYLSIKKLYVCTFAKWKSLHCSWLAVLASEKARKRASGIKKYDNSFVICNFNLTRRRRRERKVRKRSIFTALVLFCDIHLSLYIFRSNEVVKPYLKRSAESGEKVKTLRRLFFRKTLKNQCWARIFTHLIFQTTSWFYIDCYDSNWIERQDYSKTEVLIHRNALWLLPNLAMKEKYLRFR